MERSRNLGALSACIERYAQDLGQLSQSLDQLRKASRYSYCANSMRDPETGNEYAYRIVTPTRAEGLARVAEFELCATFSLASAGTDREAGPYGGRQLIWSEHGAGRSCDTVTVQLVGKTTPPAPLR
jgi:hypothetical protein